MDLRDLIIYEDLTPLILVYIFHLTEELSRDIRPMHTISGTFMSSNVQDSGYMNVLMLDLFGSRMIISEE